MASISRRQLASGSVVWRARFRGPDGEQRSRQFKRKADAQVWLDEMTADRTRGTFIDPMRSKVTFEPYAREWLASQVFEPTTREQVTSRLNGHLIPEFGRRRLLDIRPMHVQRWIAKASQQMAPRTVGVILAHLSAILTAAVDDELIAKNPCRARSVKAPRPVSTRIEPWTHQQVLAVIDQVPEPYVAAPVIAAGCGLRQGEVFGLRVSDVDFLRRQLHVRQQIRMINGRPTVGPPKNRRLRTVPMPGAVAETIAERLQAFGPGPGDLILFSREGNAVDRNHFNRYTWKPAVLRAGLPGGRDCGMHALRHFYASAMLENGVSIRALAEYLGHADPGFTLRVYAHMMPESDEKAHQAIDAALFDHIGDDAASA